MKVSIIIPTCNASNTIEKILAMLSGQTLKPFEVIIVDSSSEDDTVDIAKQYGSKTMVIPQHEFNHGRTRNIAALESEGDVLVFMTQDALPMNNTLLETLTTPLDKPHIAATFGRHIPRTDASLVEVSARLFNYPDTSSIKGVHDINKYGIKTFFFSNVCSSVKKEHFFKAGMFAEHVRTNEDMLMAAKLIFQGYTIAYISEAMVIHSHNYSLLQLFRRYYAIGSCLKKNRWILKNIRTESEGIELVKNQIRFVIGKNKYLLIPYIVLEAMTKYAGYRMGLITG